MMRIWMRAFVVIVFAFAVSSLFAAVGTVVSVQQEAYVQRGGKNIKLKLKSEVEKGDVLVTGPTGRLRILFSDNGAVNLGSDTKIALADVVPTGSKPKFSVSVVSGIGRFITGEIVKKNPEGYNIKTPHATIGIRGTIFTVELSPASDPKPQTVVSVINTGSTVTMNGTNVDSGKQLSSVPGSVPTIITPQELVRLGDLTSVPPPPMPADGMIDSTQAPGNNAVPDSKLESDAIKTEFIDAIDEMRLPQNFSGNISGNIESAGFMYEGNPVTQNGGWFDFDVNLSTGQISNAYMEYSGTVYVDAMDPTHTFTYAQYYGSGDVDGNNFNIVYGPGSTDPSQYSTFSIPNGTVGLTLDSQMNGVMTSPDSNIINAAGSYESTLTDSGSVVWFTDTGSFQGSSLP